jgi:hypothetical protein
VTVIKGLVERRRRRRRSEVVQGKVSIIFFGVGMLVEGEERGRRWTVKGH